MPGRRALKLPPNDVEIYLDYVEVQRRTTLSRSTLYRLGRLGYFPKPVKLSPGRIAWRERDVTTWMQNREQNTGSYVAG